MRKTIEAKQIEAEQQQKQIKAVIRRSDGPRWGRVCTVNLLCDIQIIKCDVGHILGILLTYGGKSINHAS